MGAQKATGPSEPDGRLGRTAAKVPGVGSVGGELESVLASSVISLPGIGKVSGQALERRGLTAVGDLLWWLPRRYDDQRAITPIAQLAPGMRAMTEGVVRSVSQAPPRGGRRLSEVRLVPRSEDLPGRYGQLRLVWFHGLPGLEKRFPAGALVRVYGRVDEHRGVITIAHPEVHVDDGAIVPRYPEIPGVTGAALRKAIQAAVARVGVFMPDAIPVAFRERAGLAPVGQALCALHAPPRDLPAETLSEWNRGESPHHHRLATEELFLLELALQWRRSEEAGLPARPCPVTPDVAHRHAAQLPFTLTAAQQLALREVSSDLGRERPMRRMLQGEVGSGKTAVALLASAQVVGAGAQVAWLVPTEVLAEQHYRNIAALAERLGLTPVLLAGKLRAGERRERIQRIEDGTANVIVGTHALLSEAVSFRDLAAVVVDEQHRFGVAQRLKLVDKAGVRAPHLLVMTATPIPRSLALVLYGDLEVSAIHALPPGRKPIITRRYPHSTRADAYRQLERALSAGGRAFVVCPNIQTRSADVDDAEDSRDAGAASARGVEEVHAELADRFGSARVVKLHAQLDHGSRAEALARFAAGSANVLVATTIVEVGVDVPEANLMLVENAERFGLAQLHQLRGRVGRGDRQSACLLVHADELTPDAELRLSAMCATNDGFELAERDLAIRGPGQLFGVRQAGGTGFRFADLFRDLERLQQARELARALVTDDPKLLAPEHAQTRRAVRRVLEQAVVAEESG